MTLKQIRLALERSGISEDTDIKLEDNKVMCLEITVDKKVTIKEFKL